MNLNLHLTCDLKLTNPPGRLEDAIGVIRSIPTPSVTAKTLGKHAATLSLRVAQTPELKPIVHELVRAARHVVIDASVTGNLAEQAEELRQQLELSGPISNVCTPCTHACTPCTHAYTPLICTYAPHAYMHPVYMRVRAYARACICTFSLCLCTFSLCLCTGGEGGGGAARPHLGGQGAPGDRIDVHAGAADIQLSSSLALPIPQTLSLYRLVLLTFKLHPSP